MYVTHIVGDRIDNLYVLAHHDNWGLDHPEGLAHWDGRKWSWCKIFNTEHARWTMSVLFDKESSILLDVGGKITVCSPNGVIQVQPPPVFVSTAPIGRFPKPPSFRDFVLLDADSFGVVGDHGLFYILEGDTWRFIETGTTQNISKIIGKPPYCYLCGDQILIQFDGFNCTKLEPGLILDMTDIDRAPDGALFMTSASPARRHYLCCWKNSSLSIEEIPGQAYYLRIVSSDEIYCGTYNVGILRWDGSSFHRSLDCRPNSRGTIANHIFFGLQNSLIYYDPPDWKSLKIDLDEAAILPTWWLEDQESATHCPQADDLDSSSA